MNLIEIKIDHNEYNALRSFTITKQAYFCSYYNKNNHQFDVELSIIAALLDSHFYVSYRQGEFMYNSKFSFTLYQAKALVNALALETRNVFEVVRKKLEQAIENYHTHDKIVDFRHWFNLRFSPEEYDSMDDFDLEVWQKQFHQSKEMQNNIKVITDEE